MSKFKTGTLRRFGHEGRIDQVRIVDSKKPWKMLSKYEYKPR